MLYKVMHRLDTSDIYHYALLTGIIDHHIQLSRISAILAVYRGFSQGTCHCLRTVASEFTIWLYALSSSGHAKSALEGLGVLKALCTTREETNGPCILPGSGINVGTIGRVLDVLLPLGLTQIHLSGAGWQEGGMHFRREGMGMGVGGEGEWGVWLTSEEKVRGVHEIVSAHARSARSGPG
jgi:hypothetical protein